MISINVKLFASLRERLEHEDFIWEVESLQSVSGLTILLGQEKGHHWREVLNESKVIVAVNQSIVDRSHEVQDGDELAFFPPVTGG